MQSDFLQSLRAVVDAEWAAIKTGPFHRRIMEGTVTRALYREMMMQVYHYTRHNATNQAVTAFVEAPEKLLKFVFRHAAEELGHERMALRDLQSVDLFRDSDLAQPLLPATEALIGYLYSVALRYGPVPRLGYSFWAEGSYVYIDGWLKKIAQDLSLGKEQMTFFSSHIQADVGHMAQVEACLKEFVTTPQQQAQVTTVARTTLFLTGQLLDQVALRHPQEPA
ncbi:MAG: iron-containing redox enzyme family protein [Ramlibacter sp.]|nr:iron-containing redox enzyme family protein [Ramlibacter sp.]